MALKSFFSALKSQMLSNSDDDNVFLANTLANIGSSYLQQGQHMQAADSLKEAMGMMKRLRKRCARKNDMSKIPLAGVLNNLGTVYLLEGDRQVSLEYYHEALKDARYCGSSKKEVTNALHNIGRVHVLQKDWDEAISVLNESLRLERELYGKDALHVVDTLNLLGFVYFSTKEYDGAMVTFAEALSIVHNKCGLVHEKVATCLLYVGMVMECQGRLEEALSTFNTSRDVFDRVGLSEEKCRGAREASKSIDKISAALNDEAVSFLKQERHQRRVNDNVTITKSPVLDTIDGTSQLRRSSRDLSARVSLWTEHNHEQTANKKYSEYREDPTCGMDYNSMMDSRDEDSEVEL
jgi:tetratricopeptide (TPR) repeat protein